MWPNPQETEDSLTFTEEILNGKPILLCSDSSLQTPWLADQRENRLF